MFTITDAEAKSFTAQMNRPSLMSNKIIPIDYGIKRFIPLYAFSRISILAPSFGLNS